LSKRCILYDVIMIVDYILYSNSFEICSIKLSYNLSKQSNNHMQKSFLCVITYLAYNTFVYIVQITPI